jgi:AAA+ ATPase superfamily predicted ATPase
MGIEYMKKPANPFLLTGYISPAYFCDRAEETRRLVSALRNGRNVTLVSPRRMGKTGLIHHAFHLLQHSDDKVSCYYVDLYQTDSFASLVRQLANAVLGTLDTRETKVLKVVASFFKSLRPTISLDPMTGEPSFSVDLQPQMAEHSLAEIFQYMEQSGRQCYIAFDEFQSIVNYGEKNVEALLRSYIQRLTFVHFVFSGSQRHILEEMFASAARPFYQSTQMMPLNEIAEDSYYAFAEEKFKDNNQQLTTEAFHVAYTQLHGHTWYVQMLLNRLYESNEHVITPAITNQTIEEITLENEATYQTFLRLITPQQGQLLRAIACEGSVKEVLGKKFLMEYQLGASSTVRSAIRTLVAKELVLDQNNIYEVYDRFFGIWLRNSRS